MLLADFPPFFASLLPGERVWGYSRVYGHATKAERIKTARNFCRIFSILQISLQKRCARVSPVGGLCLRGAGRALPIFRATNKSAFSTNANSRFASVDHDDVLGTSAPSAQHLIVSLYLCSSKATYALRLRALEGPCVSSKSPVGDRD